MQISIRPVYLLLTAMTISAVLLLLSAAKSVQHEKALAAARQAVQKVENRGFLLRESDGRLALFREGAERPYRVLSTEVWLLPEEDRLALAEGIYLADEGELKRLLEDWDSPE